jgi:integrase
VAIHRLIPSSIPRRLKTPGKHADGGGLYLQVAKPGQASWIFRHRQTWRSLGPADLFDLTEARKRAHALRLTAHDGKCPIQTLDGGAAEPAGKTFAQALAEYLKVKSPNWAASNRDRELKRYDRLFAELPWFTALPLAAITQDHKNKAIAHFPAGTKNHELAGFYIRAVLRYVEEGTLLRVVKKTGDGDGDGVEHHPSMPWQDVPAFFKRLAGVNIKPVDARALAFTILTGSRTGEVIGREKKPPACWREIGEQDGKPVWIIGGDRMKARRKHMVPLTPQMVALLGKRQADNVPLFKVSHENAMLDMLRSLDGNEYTVHGFRASFETWGAEAMRFDRDLVRLCTAHDDRTATDRAYQRSELLAKRREIMTAWSDFLTGVNL